MLRWLLLSLVVIVLDQLTKQLITANFSLYEVMPIAPMFNLTLAHNTGAAFSFLADHNGWQRWFFIGLASIVSVMLVIWLKRLKPTAKLEAFALSMIIGGAVGNVIDRIHYGYVIDFFDFYINQTHWPAFNVADAAICIGAIALIADSLFAKAETR